MPSRQQDATTERLRPTSGPARTLPTGSQRLRPSALRPTAIVIGRIAIGLQNPFPPPQKRTWTFAPPAQAEVEHRLAARFSVLPQIRLMIFTTPVVHLHRNRSFISLYIGCGEQIPP